MRIGCLAFLAFLSASQSCHAFQPTLIFGKQRSPSAPRSNVLLFAEEAESSTAELQQLRKELEEAQAFRKQMVQEIEEMESRVNRINGESKKNIGLLDSGRRDLSPLSSRDEAVKRKSEEDARLKAAEEARSKAEEEARKEKLQKEAEEAARLLAEEKAMLKQAEVERQALMDKMAKLKTQFETKKQESTNQFSIARHALDAGLATGFVSAVIFGRFLLADRDEVKAEAAESAGTKRTQPVRSTFQIEDIAPKTVTKPSTSGRKTYMVDDSKPPKSYSPFGGAKPQATAGSDSLYAPPPSASKPAAVAKPAPQKASARIAATVAKLANTSPPPTPPQSKQSPIPAPVETKPITPVQSTAGTVPPTPPAEPSPSQQPDYAIGGASYMDTLGGSSGAPVVNKSYSPFGTMPPQAPASSNFLYASPVNGSRSPPDTPLDTSSAVPLQEPIVPSTPVTDGASYTDFIGSTGSASPVKSSYSPFGSNPKAPPSADSLYAPPPTPQESQSVAPPPPSEAATRGPPAPAETAKTATPKKSYLPYGTKPQGKPWWNSPPSSR